MFAAGGSTNLLGQRHSPLRCALILILFRFIYLPFYDTNDDHRDAVVATVVEVAGGCFRPTPKEWQPPSLEHV